jgi:hypothetical protein
MVGSGPVENTKDKMICENLTGQRQYWEALLFVLLINNLVISLFILVVMSSTADKNEINSEH